MKQSLKQSLSKPEVALLNIAETAYSHGLQKLQADRQRLIETITQAHDCQPNDRVQFVPGGDNGVLMLVNEAVDE